MANRDHQHTTPFDDRNDIESLPQELRQVARRYATLRVPHPTSEETGELIGRLQTLASPNLSRPPARPPQRRRCVGPLLNALAAILIVGILAASFLYVLALRQRHPTAPSVGGIRQPISLQTIHMIDATTGWALTNSTVLYTTTGWNAWKDVTPGKAANVVGGYFLSGKEAWIAEAEQRPGATVFHTTDGGQTWQSAILSANVPLSSDRMSFINNKDGWIEAETGGATGNDLEIIFRTTDGGKSWTAVSRTSLGSHDSIPATFPFSGHKTGLTFINASTGWATGPWLYITHDGGASWQQQILPTAPGQIFAPPTFFNARDGILPASSQLFITHDSGTTWQSTSLLPALSSLETAFIDMQHGWVAASTGTDLYSTSDGGGHWVTITPRIAASITAFAQLNFVSPEIGWALGYTTEPPNTLLLRTTDGGQTWTQFPLTTT